MKISPAIPHAGSSRLYEATRRRLQEMSQSRFHQLQPDGSLLLVGRASDPWTEDELSLATERVRDLASDPARGDKITPMGLEEATVALSAENLHAFTRLEREKTGASEFQAPDGSTWDVKSPFSPPPDQGWEYSPEHQLEKVRDDLAQGDNILLNLTRVTPEDRDRTVDYLRQNLPIEERGQVLIFSDLNPA